MLMVGCAGEPVVSEGCSSHAPSSQRPSATKTAAQPAAPPCRMGAVPTGGLGVAYHALATPTTPGTATATITGHENRASPPAATEYSSPPITNAGVGRARSNRSAHSGAAIGTPPGAAREPGPGQVPPPPSAGPARRPADHRRVAPRLRRARGSRSPGRAAPFRRPCQQERAKPPIIPGRHQVARRPDSRAAPGAGRGQEGRRRSAPGRSRP